MYMHIKLNKALVMYCVILCSFDTTETGYALGKPAQRETIPSTERALAPPACAIVRALMHCSLLWSSCTNEVEIHQNIVSRFQY